MRFFFFELIKTVMGIHSLAGHFFWNYRRRFFKKRHARLVVPFARICAFVLLVSTMLGLRAWSDDFVAVLFEFLDDDTKLAQSCTDWLYVQHWYTVVPDPAMRVALWEQAGIVRFATQLVPWPHFACVLCVCWGKWDREKRRYCSLSVRSALLVCDPVAWTRAKKEKRGSFSGTPPPSTPTRARWPPWRRSSLTSYCASSRHKTRPRLRQLGGVHCVPTAMPTSKKPTQRPRHSIPATSSSPSTSSRSPLPMTPWTGPWKRRQTARTTRPCQTRRLSLRWLTCRRARPTSNLERCIALRLVVTRRSHRPKKIALASYHIFPQLSHVSVVPCVVSLCCGVRWCPAQAPRQWQEGLLFFSMASKKVLTQGDFCAVLWMSQWCKFKQARLWIACTGTGVSTGGRAHSPRVSRVDHGVQHVCKFLLRMLGFVLHR